MNHWTLDAHDPFSSQHLQNAQKAQLAAADYLEPDSHFARHAAEGECPRRAA